MSPLPRVSVVMPCFDAGRTLADTLDSLLGQTLAQYELIAVNDGSTDGTQGILDAYAARFGERMVALTQANAGQTAAKNRALELARGAYVALLDSDDLWHPEKLARQAAFLDAHPEVGLCYTDGEYIDAAGRSKEAYGTSPRLRGQCALELILGNDIVASSVMFRRSLLAEIGAFDPGLLACENWDLWTRIASVRAIDFLPEHLTYYRQHDHNMSRNLDKMRHYRLEVVEKNRQRFAGRGADFAQRVEQARYEAHASFGRYFLWNLDTRSARRDLWAAIRLRPRVLKNYALLAKSMLGARAIAALRRLKGRLAGRDAAAH